MVVLSRQPTLMPPPKRRPAERLVRKVKLSRHPLLMPPPPKMWRLAR